MTNEPTVSLSDRLAAVTIAHPGVRTLYSPQPLAVDLAASALALVLPQSTPTDRVQVSEGSDGTRVQVVVGVRAGAGSVQTCRDLYAVIAAELTAVGAPHPFDITVRVATIG